MATTNLYHLMKFFIDADTVSVGLQDGEQAARPDDAEAEAEDWDKWMVESFVSSSSSHPLVCTGTYHAEHHS